MGVLLFWFCKQKTKINERSSSREVLIGLEHGITVLFIMKPPLFSLSEARKHGNGKNKNSKQKRTPRIRLMIMS